VLSLLDGCPSRFLRREHALVSARGITLDTLDQYQGLKIYVEGDEMFEYVLGKLGAEVVTRAQSERIENFNASRYEAVECDTQSLGELRLPANNALFTVCESFHRARINWLFLSEKSRAALSVRQRAVTSTEAVAYAVAENDALVLAREEQGLKQVRQAGGELLAHNYNEFSRAMDEILRAAPRYGAIWDWDLHESLRQIALQSE
jgi:TRAP-type C4-dicarboxylate transport system substrate-binding protein